MTLCLSLCITLLLELAYCQCDTTSIEIDPSICPQNNDQTLPIWIGLDSQCNICTLQRWEQGNCNQTAPIFCSEPPLYESDGVSYWKLLRPLQPMIGYKYGSIQLKTNMYLRFSFTLNSYDVAAADNQFLGVFRIGAFEPGHQFSCDRLGSRYPAVYIRNGNLLQIALSSKITCWGNAFEQKIRLIPEFNLSVNVRYSMEMRYDLHSVYFSIANHTIIYNGSYETLNTSLNENVSVIINDPGVLPADVTIWDLLIVSYDDNDYPSRAPLPTLYISPNVPSIRPTVLPSLVIVRTTYTSTTKEQMEDLENRDMDINMILIVGFLIGICVLVIAISLLIRHYHTVKAKEVKKMIESAPSSPAMNERNIVNDEDDHDTMDNSPHKKHETTSGETNGSNVINADLVMKGSIKMTRGQAVEHMVNTHGEDSGITEQ